MSKIYKVMLYMIPMVYMNKMYFIPTINKVQLYMIPMFYWNHIQHHCDFKKDSQRNKEWESCVTQGKKKD